MRHISTNNYQKQFVKLALRRLPHRVTLAFAVKTRLKPLVRFLGRYAERRFIGTSELVGYTESDLLAYTRITSSTSLWHGTGRYQHDQTGEVVDVLDSILKSKRLKPFMDDYTVFTGGKRMNSISLTELRIIARSYGDMHGKGYHESCRYGDALMWTSYYYGLFYASVYTRSFFKVRMHYKTWHKLTHDQNGHNTWGKKANQSAEDVWDVFGLGTDIRGNYPIVLGIQDLEHTVLLPPVFRDYEVRVSRPISITRLTHIEVPMAKLEEVARLVSKYGLKLEVVPIELGELAASRLGFGGVLTHK